MAAMLKLVIAAALISTIVAIECQSCQSMTFKDESMATLMQTMGADMPVCNSTMKATCNSTITGCATVSLDLTMTMGTTDVDLSMTMKQCDMQLNGQSIVTCDLMEAGMKEDTSNTFKKMENCKVKTCTGTMCNSGANTVYASVLLMAVALLYQF